MSVALPNRRRHHATRKETRTRRLLARHSLLELCQLQRQRNTPSIVLLFRRHAPTATARGVDHRRHNAGGTAIGNSSDILRYLYGRYAGKQWARDKVAFMEPTPEAVELERRLDDFGVSTQHVIYHYLLQGGPRTTSTRLQIMGVRDERAPAWQKLALQVASPLLRKFMLRAFRPSHYPQVTVTARAHTLPRASTNMPGAAVRILIRGIARAAAGCRFHMDELDNIRRCITSAWLKAKRSAARRRQHPPDPVVRTGISGSLLPSCDLVQLYPPNTVVQKADGTSGASWQTCAMSCPNRVSVWPRSPPLALMYALVVAHTVVLEHYSNRNRAESACSGTISVSEGVPVSTCRPWNEEWTRRWNGEFAKPSSTVCREASALLSALLPVARRHQRSVRVSHVRQHLARCEDLLAEMEDLLKDGRPSLLPGRTEPSFVASSAQSIPFQWTLRLTSFVV